MKIKAILQNLSRSIKNRVTHHREKIFKKIQTKIMLPKKMCPEINGKE